MANLFSLSGLLLGLTGTILAIIILYLRKSRLHFVWMLFNIAVALWGWGSFFLGRMPDSYETLMLWRVSYIPILFISVFFVHVVYELCNIKSKKVLIFAYIHATIAAVLSVFTDKYIAGTRLIFDNLIYAYVESIVGKISFLIWVGLVAYGIYQLIKSYSCEKGLKKNQILYFLVAMAVGFSSGLTNFIPYLGFNIYPVGNFGIVVYCIIVTYAVFKYRLMDIKLVFRKSMVYSISAGVLTSIFVVLVLAMTKFLSYIAGVSSFAITAIAALIIAFLFTPLKTRIQSVIDKNFYKKAYDYYPTIRKISRKLTSVFDLNELFTYVGDILYLTLGLKSVYILYAIPGKGYEIVYHKLYIKGKSSKGNHDESDNTKLIKKNSEIVQYFRKYDDILIRDELPGVVRVLGQEIIERINAELRPFDGETVVPVFADKKLILLLVLGEKVSGDMFTNEDINLLNIVSNQTTIAIRNTELYEDKVHTERLASIGMMSATFAHEIRNPLTSLKTFAQLMPEKYNDEEFRNTFSKIVVKEIERINSLIGDLLDFSSDKKSGRINEFEIKSFIDEIIEYTRGRLEIDSQNILIEKVYNNIDINMYGDVEKLKQAFTNIINNGCQAMNGEGVLTISIKPNARHVEISIGDTGEGIHSDDLPKIFDPFVTTKEMGVGLGLAISKRVIEDHLGKIKVKSKLSKGTKFTISLPIPSE